MTEILEYVGWLVLWLVVGSMLGCGYWWLTTRYPQLPTWWTSQRPGDRNA